MKVAMQKGKIITIEGSDGSGKKTQTKLLVERAMKARYNVATMSFPQYDKPTGQRVRDYLDGKLGDLKSVDPRFSTKLYAEDRFAAKPKIMNWLKYKTNVIFDRWIESNMGHQSAKFGKEDRIKFVEWIRRLEMGQNGLPESDLVVYLDLPVEYNQRAMEKEGRTKDLHEKDVNYLLKVEDTYKWLARTNKNWVVIDCLKRDFFSGDTRKSIEEINDEIWGIVEPVLVKENLLDKIMRLLHI